jgi:hypothetical protein
MRRLAAIRKLANQYPLDSADERLKTIELVASGKGDISGYFKASVNTAPPPEKSRKLKGGHDRQETGGTDREE